MRFQRVIKRPDRLEAYPTRVAIRQSRSDLMNAAQEKIVVIGYGSPIRGDDAVGPLAADRLMEEPLPDDVEVISRHTLDPDLVATLANASLVVFLDASIEGPEGVVVCRDLRPEENARRALVHALDPAQLLAWVEQLFDHVPDAFLVSTRGISFEFANCELTPPVAAAVEPMLSKVRKLIRSHQEKRLAAAPESLVKS
jgi:hydrogenase maturation protease